VGGEERDGDATGRRYVKKMSIARDSLAATEEDATRWRRKDSQKQKKPPGKKKALHRAYGGGEDSEEGTSDRGHAVRHSRKSEQSVRWRMKGAKRKGSKSHLLKKKA